MEQLKKNIATFQEEKPLNAQEMDALLGIAAQMLEKKTLPKCFCFFWHLFFCWCMQRMSFTSKIIICQI